MSSPVITRITESLAHLCYSAIGRRLRLFSHYTGLLIRTDMKSYAVWSEHPDPLCDSPLYY